MSHRPGSRSRFGTIRKILMEKMQALADCLHMKDLAHVHPSADMFEEYATHRLTEAGNAFVEEHLLLCESCCDALTATDREIELKRLVLGGASHSAAGQSCT